MFHFRPATAADIEPICALDEISQQEAGRRAFIEDSVRAGYAHVVTSGESVVGYGVLHYNFFSQGFIAMLYIHRDHRRAGAGTSMMRHLETLCRTEKLFTSTNLSNLPMQALLGKLGYQPSGVIHNLDPGDPELIYVRFRSE